MGERMNTRGRTSEIACWALAAVTAVALAQNWPSWIRPAWGVVTIFCAVVWIAERVSDRRARRRYRARGERENESTRGSPG